MKDTLLNIELTEDEINHLINFIYAHVEIGDVRTPVILGKILDQKIKQKHPILDDGMFPDTDWNNYILAANTRIIELDNDKKAQKDFIFKCFHDMEINPIFDIKDVIKWFDSQMLITGNKQCVGMFTYAGLYTERLDIANILSHINPKFLKKD